MIDHSHLWDLTGGVVCHPGYQPPWFPEICRFKQCSSPDRQPLGKEWKYSPFQAQMEPFTPDAVIDITAIEKMVQILPGEKTVVWGYDGRLLSGSGVTVDAVPG